MANKLMLKRGTKAKLPALSVGEPAFTTDTKELFVGATGGNVQIPNMTQLGNLATVATHAKAGTVHSLTLAAKATTGIQLAQFKATADYTEGNTWKVGGVVYTAKLQGEDGALPDKLFVVGDMVSVMLDPVGKKLGFKSGGGGDAKLNVFCQLAQPTAPDGVWVKMADKPTKILIKTFDDVAVEDTWDLKAPVPIPINSQGGVSHNNEIFLFGGAKGTSSVASNILASTYIYNTINNSWRSGTNMISARTDITAQQVNGIAYVLGGFLAGNFLNLNHAYSIDDNLWTAKAPMLRASYGLGSAVVNGKIYAIGGGYSGETGTESGRNDAFDPQTNLWTALSPMPTAKRGLVCVAVGAIIYIMGGGTMTVTGATVHAYDTLSGLYTARSALPIPLYAPSADNDGTIIYIFNGVTTGNKSSAKTFAFDTTTNTWTEKKPDVYPRGYGTANRVDNKIYVMGGLLTTHNNAYVLSDPQADGTLVLRQASNYNTGKKSKLISNPKVSLYNYIDKAYYHKNGLQATVPSAANYDNTGWINI